MRWLELLKNYDMSLHYHLGKANVVVDALSRLSMGSLSHIEEGKKEMVKEIHQLTNLGVRLLDFEDGEVLYTVFHVSMLKKCIGDHSLVLHIAEINVKDSLTYEEEPVAIMDPQVQKLRRKKITSVKVLWKNEKAEEATWEPEDDKRARYPNLFETVDDDSEELVGYPKKSFECKGSSLETVVVDTDLIILLEIKQASEGLHHVPRLEEVKVESIKEVWNVLQTESSARAVGFNNVKEYNSRSHCMLCIMVTANNVIDGECTKRKLWLMDLAGGSERLVKINVQGDRLKEAQNINRSLSSLGDMISALVNRSSDIPYRWGIKALMFVQISSSDKDLSETMLIWVIYLGNIAWHGEGRSIGT
ncbi:hypothetical protein FXO38_08528 [Capsicum annuum]|nr:hypothetical protein FXO38_08528 [Capsicum annuum]